METVDDLKQEREISVTDAKVDDRLKVLVVEDDQTQWPLWENILTSCHPNVEVDWERTETGAEALLKQAYQAGRPYGLVISDVFLEGHETGIDLWNRYGEAAKNFVFVSGMSFPKFDSMMHAQYGPAPIYIRKPLSVQNCKNIINYLCGTMQKEGK